MSAEVIRTYQGREVVANSLAGERQELVKVKIVVSHFCCKLDLVVVEKWIVITEEGLESTWPMDMDMTDCGNGFVLISQRNAAWDTEELGDALTYNILWIQIVP